MGDMLQLIISGNVVLGKLVIEGGFNVDEFGSIPLHRIGKIAVDQYQEPRNFFKNERMKSLSKLSRGLNTLTMSWSNFGVSLLGKTGVMAVSLLTHVTHRSSGEFRWIGCNFCNS